MFRKKNELLYELFTIQLSELVKILNENLNFKFAKILIEIFNLKFAHNGSS